MRPIYLILEYSDYGLCNTCDVVAAYNTREQAVIAMTGMDNKRNLRIEEVYLRS